MHSTKPIFISFYFLYLAISFTLIGFKLLTGELDEIYFFASFLSLVAPILYFIYLYYRKPKEVSFLSILIFMSIAASTLITIGYYFTEGSVYRYPMIISILSLTLWILYISWFVKNPKIDKGLLTKELNDSESFQTFVKQSSYPNKLVLFVNNRFHPFSTRQIIDFNKYKSNFQKAKTDTIYIGNDLEFLNSMLDRENLNEKHLTSSMNLKSIINSDKSLFPLGNKFRDNASIQPIAVLIDKNDEIRHIHISKDDRISPEPQFFLKIIEEF